VIQGVAQVASTARRATVAARVVDLCCGMGGLSVAAREMGMRVVAGVDVNLSALRTFSRNFPEAEAIEGRGPPYQTGRPSQGICSWFRKLMRRRTRRIVWPCLRAVRDAVRTTAVECIGHLPCGASGPASRG